MAVYVANLIVNTDSDFTQTFTFEDASTNSGLDLSGYTINAQMRKHPDALDSTKTTFTTTILSTSGGRIQLSLTDTQTATLKDGRHVYDIVLTDGSGNKTRIIEGSVLVSKGVTR
tara:strand:- start:866 stop:1210 length:345 start_codon:yes stop_codon:yes gene_type:complete